MADDEQQVKPQVTWDIADVSDASLTQRMAGDLYYMPEPRSTNKLSYPAVESKENQAYSGDSPAIKSWAYIDAPIKVHPLLPGKPGGGTKPIMTLYLHARITADGKLQLAVFAEKCEPDTMMLSWDAADVAVNGGCVDQLTWEGDKYSDLTIADIDAADDVLVHNGKLNTKYDPKLIGPLAPCARVNIWDSCGGGGPVVTYGHLHSLWGCIVDNVLYMHVFCHEEAGSRLGEYVVVAAGRKGDRCAYGCGCRRVKVELPPVLYNMCPTVLDCPPAELDPDPYDIYDILGFKQSLCCGADIIANARRLAIEVIGVDDSGTSLLMERDIAEMDDSSAGGGCGIVQHHKGDISAEYTLLTKHGGMYNGGWVVTKRTGLCDSPKGNAFKPWSTEDGFPYEKEADHGSWEESGQSFGGFEWPSQEDREKGGSSAQCAFLYSMSGKAHIELLRYGRILEANTVHELSGATSTSDVYVTVPCCTGCAGCEACPGGTLMGAVDFGASGPTRYVHIELSAHLCRYEYASSSDLDRKIIAEMTWGGDKKVPIAEAVQELIEGSSVLSQLIGVRSASGSALSLYLVRKDNNSIDTCVMDIEYKVGASASATAQVQFTECTGRQSRALTGPATPMAARAVTAVASSGQAPYVPMYDFKYKVSVYNGTEVSSVSGAAADMQDMATDATRALQDGLSIVASDDGLLTVRSASGERTVVVNLYSGEDGTTPIQTVTVFVEK